VLNVLLGERYKNITKETQAILRGEYGDTPIPVDKELQRRVLQDDKPITKRPADLLKPELQSLADELDDLAEKHRFRRAPSSHRRTRMQPAQLRQPQRRKLRHNPPAPNATV
jgi:oxaloacetate decarboxylase alpha subunit